MREFPISMAAAAVVVRGYLMPPFITHFLNAPPPPPLSLSLQNSYLVVERERKSSCSSNSRLYWTKKSWPFEVKKPILIPPRLHSTFLFSILSRTQKPPPSSSPAHHFKISSFFCMLFDISDNLLLCNEKNDMILSS